MSTIVLDKERHIQLDLNAMVKFEEVTGKSLFKKEALENMGAGDLRALLWAALVHEDAKLTVEQVGSMVTIDNMVAISDALTKAWVKGNDNPNPL